MIIGYPALQLNSILWQAFTEKLFTKLQLAGGQFPQITAMELPSDLGPLLTLDRFNFTNTSLEKLCIAGTVVTENVSSTLQRDTEFRYSGKPDYTSDFINF